MRDTAEQITFGDILMTILWQKKWLKMVLWSKKHLPWFAMEEESVSLPA
jgi:hypothetical protein